jgi:prepilin-type N-terminal cleavage/methylation domain-containing protein
MRNKRKGFTLIELLIVVVIVGILALAAIPLITANTRDARRSEGEQMLGSMKNQVKVAYAKLGATGMPGQLSGNITDPTPGCNVTVAQLSGKYFDITDTFVWAAPTATITAMPGTNGNSSDGNGVGAFNMDNPSADTITWS